MFSHVSVILFTGEEFCLQRGRGVPTGGEGLPLEGGVCLQGGRPAYRGGLPLEPEKRVVCILLECFLVFRCISTIGFPWNALAFYKFC